MAKFKIEKTNGREEKTNRSGNMVTMGTHFFHWPRQARYVIRQLKRIILQKWFVETDIMKYRAKREASLTNLNREVAHTDLWF